MVLSDGWPFGHQIILNRRVLLHPHSNKSNNSPQKPHPYTQSHWGKFLCLGVTLCVIAAAAIAIPLLWFKEPTAILLNQSNLQLDGGGSVTVDLSLSIKNPNRYPGMHD